ncbi:pyridoxal phosphate-dependent transferase, partial [Colletotrichum phormii]
WLWATSNLIKLVSSSVHLFPNSPCHPALFKNTWTMSQRPPNLSLNSPQKPTSLPSDPWSLSWPTRTSPTSMPPTKPPSNLIVHSAVAKFTSDALYNPHPKPQWQNAVEETRTLVGRYINADPSSLAFTRDTTEALGCFIRSLKFEPGDNVVVLDTENPNQVYGWMALRKAGLEIRQVPTIPAAEETGHVTAANAATFAPYVDERTKAIGLSSIMFHSGQWNDVADICATYRPRGVHVLADLTQQVGFAEVDVRALGVSAAAFSLHKGLNCPTGFAVLYVDSEFIADTDPTPPIVGYRAVSNS